MGLNTAPIPGGLGSDASSANWWSGWRERIRVGVMTGSWEPFPILDRNSRIRPWATFFAGTGFRLPGNGAGTRRGRTSSQRIWRCWPSSRRRLHHSAYGGVGRCRLLHRRSVDMARSDHLLRAVLPACGDPTCKPGRYHPASHRRVDDANGRNAIDETSGYLRQHRFMLHDHDTKFCEEFRKTLAAGGVKCLRLPARSPNLNAFAERWVRSVKEECLS